jgi:hypothetical protein
VDPMERDLANRLFAVAMGILEDAIEPATRGQAHTASRSRILASAVALNLASQKIGSIAAAISAVVSGAERVTSRTSRSKRSRRNMHEGVRASD